MKRLKRSVAVAGLATALSVWGISPASARTWTDTQGRKTEAEFVGVNNGVVQLKSADGRIHQVPIEQLSSEDRRAVAAEMGIKHANPAAPAAPQDAGPAAPPAAAGAQDEQFSEAIRQNPENAGAYYQRALARLNRGDAKQAVADFDQAIKLNPKSAEAYDGRGQAQAAAGDPVAAAKDFDKAIELNPSLPMAYQHRGDNLKEMAKSPAGKELVDAKIEAYRKMYQAARDRQLTDKSWQPLNSTSGPTTRQGMIGMMARADYDKAKELGTGYGGGGSGGSGSGSGSGYGKGSGSGTGPAPQQGPSKPMPPETPEPGLIVLPETVAKGENVTLVADPDKLASGGPQEVTAGYGKKPTSAKVPYGRKKAESAPVLPTSVDFYRDTDGDGKLDTKKDELLATDAEPQDGYSAEVSTANFPYGQQRYFAAPKGTKNAADKGKGYGNKAVASGTGAISGTGKIVPLEQMASAAPQPGEKPAGKRKGGGGYAGPRDAKAARAIERAIGLADRHDYGNAVTEYDRLLTDYVDDPYYLRGRAGVHLKQGGYDLAIRDYNRVIEVEEAPTAEIYYNRGCAYLSVGNLPAAVADFTESLKLDELGQFANLALNNRGAAYARQGQFAQAVADFEAAIKLSPNDPVAYRNRSQALRKLGKTAEADADLAKATQLGAGA